MIGDIRCIISRTGYTGEDGVEIYMAPEDARGCGSCLWTRDRRKADPMRPGGQGHPEAGGSMPLYGHEMDDCISPKEAGLGIFVKMDKEDFIGKRHWWKKDH